MGFIKGKFALNTMGTVTETINIPIGILMVSATPGASTGAATMEIIAETINIPKGILMISVTVPIVFKAKFPFIKPNVF